MTDDPLVSIIIPAYNYARFLPFAVDSALNQSYSNVEVIVVNDGSKDETHEIAQSYGDRIRYIHQENQGLSAARNSGIRAANGEYLVFLDADDILALNMVEQSQDTLRELGPDFAVVAHLPDLINQEGVLIDKSWGFPKGDTEVTFLDLLIQNRFPTIVLVLKRALDEVGDFDPDLKASEDRDMWIRIARKFRIYRLSNPLSSVRRHGTNMSSDGVRQSDAIKQVHQKARQRGDLKGRKSIYWLKIASFFQFQKAMMTGHTTPINAIGNLVVSFSLWPVFGDRKKLGQPALFRVRLTARIIRDWLFKLNSQTV